MKKIWSMYFSGTGTTERVVKKITDIIAEKLGAERGNIDFTPKSKREIEYTFSKDDIVVFGTPVIAGRVPNVLLKFLENIRGEGALTIPIVMFGNRNYDDALIELRDILIKDNFIPIAAGAFVGEHSFSNILGKGRPDREDFEIVEFLSEKAVENIEKKEYLRGNLYVKGETPYRWYYQPRDSKGNPIDIRKVKPKTDMNRCTNCGICAEICPMSSIDRNNVDTVNGICIKCCACIKKCPVSAKYFDDKNFIYHKEELELEYKRRAKVEIFYKFI